MILKRTLLSASILLASSQGAMASLASSAAAIGALSDRSAYQINDVMLVSELQRQTQTTSNVQQGQLVLASELADTDGDNTLESPGMHPTIAGYAPPTGGGFIPTSSMAAKTDGYGMPIGYCAWDNGTATGSGSHIAGDNPVSNGSVSLVVISSGKDRVFNTSCADAKTGSFNGDDVASMLTVGQGNYGANASAYIGRPVADAAALFALDTSLTQPGELRMVLDEGTTYAWLDLNGDGTYQWEGAGSKSYFYSGDSNGATAGGEYSSTPFGVGIGAKFTDTNVVPTSELEVDGQVRIIAGTDFVDNDLNAQLHVGSQVAAATTPGEVARIAIQPYGHTGGPFGIIARDDATHTHLDFRYGPTATAADTMMTLKPMPGTSGNGLVGIGAPNPVARLTVSGTDDEVMGPVMMLHGQTTDQTESGRIRMTESKDMFAGAYLHYNGNNTHPTVSPGTGTLFIGVNNNTSGRSTAADKNVMAFTRSGLVGINTDIPDSASSLHVRSAGGPDADTVVIIESDPDNLGSEEDNPRLHLRQDGGGIQANFGLTGTADLEYNQSLVNAAYLEIAESAANTGSLQFVTGRDNDLAGSKGTARMTILADGNIGIGTNAPISKLTVNNRTTNATTSNGLLLNEDRSDLAAYPDGFASRSLVMGANNTPLVVMGMQGYVQSPSAATLTNFIISTDPSGFYTNGYYDDPEFVITPTGNVGIGIKSPTEKLDVNGTVRSDRLAIRNAPDTSGTEDAYIHVDQVGGFGDEIGILLEMDGDGDLNEDGIFTAAADDIALELRSTDPGSTNTNLATKFRLWSDGDITSSGSLAIGPGNAGTEQSITLNGNKVIDSIGRTIRYEAPMDLVPGWYTIATNQGDRASAKFGIRGERSSVHSNTVFYASHLYGNDNVINVISHNDYASRHGITKLRIKKPAANQIYDGAMLQVYVEDGQNTFEVYMLGDNFHLNGWTLKNWVPDGTDPGGLNNYANVTVPDAEVDLGAINKGGLLTSGNLSVSGVAGFNDTGNGRGATFHHVGSFGDSTASADLGNVKGYTLKTNIDGPTPGKNTMHTVNINGYAYGASKNVDFSVSFYVYGSGNTIRNVALTNKGTYSPATVEVAEGTDGKVWLRFSTVAYIMRFHASHFLNFGDYSPEQSQGWTLDTTQSSLSALSHYQNVGTAAKQIRLFYTNETAEDDWENSPISIRERELVASSNTAPSFAPNLNFHWGGVNSNSLWMSSDGTLNYGSYNGTGTPNDDGHIQTQNLAVGSINFDKYDNWVAPNSVDTNAQGGSAGIVNDNNAYKALMILGNRSADGSKRRIEMWDEVKVNGTVTAWGHATSSDRRLKKNIETIAGGLGIIKNLNGVSYNWKEDVIDDKTTQYGFIAQELMEVLPDAVVHNGKHYTVKYDAITPVLVEAVKELDEKVDDIEVKTDHHEVKIQEYETRILTLEDQVRAYEKRQADGKAINPDAPAANDEPNPAAATTTAPEPKAPKAGLSRFYGS